ncbi:MAG: xanthine dehydrogenase molybdopterin binding subunit [Vibrio sp.]
MSNYVEKRSVEQLMAQYQKELTTGVGRGLKHDSADKQVSGEAVYVDDKLTFPNQLYVYLRLSEIAHGKITNIDTSPCYQHPEVATVLTSQLIPGDLDIGAVFAGDPLLADGVVEYLGQPIIAVAASSYEAARRAAMDAIIEVEPLTPILDVKEALAKQSFVHDSHIQQRGDWQTAYDNAPHQIQGELYVGGQEHFYLETQAAQVLPAEDGGVIVYCSTQNPTEIQKVVAKVLGVAMHKVVVDMRRMGGGFGGKETQANAPACIAAVVAQLTQRPAKVRLERQTDMLMTGKRHPFYHQYQVGFDEEGRLQGVHLEMAGDCGYSIDLSHSIVDRAMFHADNAYYLGDAKVIGHRCKTNYASNTAFRGFGGPQGMMVIEHIMDEIAQFLGRDPLEIRQLNYYGQNQRNQTHYYQTVEDNCIQAITDALVKSSDYQKRLKAIDDFNAANPILKKGIALTPVKFGISFTAGFLNQAGALIHIYTDGSIHLNHGGTEMGQGLNTKVAQIVAEVFSVDISRIQITATNTDKVPNTSPTAASSGTDLNGKAAQNAALTIKQRLVEFAAKHYQITEEEVHFHNGVVKLRETWVSFEELVQQAYFGQVSLSSTGFYRTPKIYYDHANARGRPFYYFAYGASCSEVVIDTLTGEYKLLRNDILHDVGASLNPAIDIGQIEGGFIQGMGWLTCEELVWNPEGRLMTASPASYKIPAISDMPAVFNTDIVENRKNPEDTVYHSKAVGEPPFMLAMSVWSALKNAIYHGLKANEPAHQHRIQLDTPATPERVLMALNPAQQSKEQR